MKMTPISIGKSHQSNADISSRRMEPEYCNRFFPGVDPMLYPYGLKKHLDPVQMPFGTAQDSTIFRCIPPINRFRPYLGADAFIIGIGALRVRPEVRSLRHHRQCPLRALTLALGKLRLKHARRSKPLPRGSLEIDAFQNAGSNRKFRIRRFASLPDGSPHRRRSKNDQ